MYISTHVSGRLFFLETLITSELVHLTIFHRLSLSTHLPVVYLHAKAVCMRGEY